MARMLLLGLSLIGIGAVAGAVAGSRGGSDDPPVVAAVQDASAPAPVRPGFRAQAVDSGATAPADELRRRVDALTAQVAADATARHRLQERIDELATQLAALDRGVADTGRAASSEPSGVPAPHPSTDVGWQRPAGDGIPHQGADPAASTVSMVERALVAAGIDTATAADIKRRRDDLALAEVYLRDQATREQWLDAPRFADEMAKIDGQRTTMRDEVGDDAYDAYLAFLGHPNRVRVEDVLSASPAAQAGVQPGDIVVRYGETRLFAVEELVKATHGGQLGESVEVEIMRDGQPLQIAVPRGPLGISIGSTVERGPAGR